MRPNAFLLRSALAVALGGLLFGFDTAVIAGTTRSLTALYHLTAAGLGLTVSSALLGTIPGAMFAGTLGDRLGRRDGLRIPALLYLISALGCACSPDWYSLLCFRFIGGLGIGGSSVLSPMYIAEISPPRWRGRLVGLFQFNIVFGILLAYFCNYLIGTLNLGGAEWRWKLGIAAVPAVLFLVLLFRIPRSPRWLAEKNRIDEAREVLRAVGSERREEELREIVQSIESEPEEPLFARKYRLPIFLAISIGLFNQFSGINAILYYLNDIFDRAGFSKVSGDVQSVAIGATNLLFTVIAMTVIDRVGRRFLLLTGAVGTAACLAGVAAIFFTGRHAGLLLWLLAGFIASFAFSQGAVIWVYLAEVFPTRVRGKGQSLGSFTHWFTNALISGIFPLMAASSGGVPFVFFAAMMVLQFFVVLTVYPETKAVSLEAMQRKMTTARKSR
ncbi:MAG TPA: sugar porter family MFS transporter [Bryobacteraceae bacterium]|nr:sugar porter family MFS transporter [Bryobacteraceae bacterium]